jgi:RNA polymerase sigma-70 factor (ECF subfamily)
VNRHQKYDDDFLVNKFSQTHDNYWLGILLERYTLLLLGVCMKYLKNEDYAKDAVQQIFLKVIHELPKNKITFFKSWLYEVAKNQCLSQLRTNKKFILEELSDSSDELSEDKMAQTAAQKEENYRYLETAFAQLNGEQKTCISLFFFEKKSYAEIAETTGFSDAQVKSNIQNGKRNLKKLIEKMKQDNG